MVALGCILSCSAGGTSRTARVPCGEVSTCPNDAPPNQADKDTCDAQVSEPCGPYYQAYHDCYGNERVCAFNGTTDVIATQQACLAEFEAVTACLSPSHLAESPGRDGGQGAGDAS